jgi:energy-coupling factor transporter ATP-binding protein EcfA2
VKSACLVIERLESLGFEVREEDVRLFGERIPFVRAIAVDRLARQLVVVAEDVSEEADDWVKSEGSWRDLLFAVSGLRRQLSGSRPAALSQPVLIAIAPSAVVTHLRGLVEDVVTEYALFTRIDLNILDRDAKAPADIDRGMASVLPKTREAIKKGTTVATQDVEQFWVELAVAVDSVGETLRDRFDTEIVATAVEDLMGELRSDLDRPQGPELSRKPEPIFHLELRDFRSFEKAEIESGAATIVHGANGSGKTSICEAMEILWSGRSRRIPDGEKATAYEKHLNYEGRPFHLCTADGELTADSIVSEPEAILGRTALPQELLTEMADGAPTERFRAFLEASGLELPEFEERLKERLHGSLDRLNGAFAEVGIKRVPAVNRDGAKVLEQALAVGFAARIASPDRIHSAADALEKETGGAYKANVANLMLEVDQVEGRLLELDATLAEFATHRRRARSPSDQMEDTGRVLRQTVARLREAAQPLSLLQRHLQTMADASLARTVESLPVEKSSPIPPALRARWLAQARNLEADIESLERLGAGIDDPSWRRRLETYLEALREALDRSSRPDLERLVDPESSRAVPRVTSSVEEPSPQLLRDAGFKESPPPTPAIIESILALQFELSRQADLIEAIANDIVSHPAAAFAASGSRVESALCRFELDRELTKPNGALTKARGALVGRLLDERLTPVVRELVDALVRFEWYFKPLEVEVSGRGLRFHGLSTDNPKLDIRMLLNAAERTIVGIAWFLGLHLTQEKSDRKVLILDDPASGFDETNKAAFVSTLSVLLDLLDPEQFLITTHDDALVAVLEVELGRRTNGAAPLTLLHCRRTETGTSEVRPRPPQPGPRPDLEAELEALHFDFAAPPPAKTE